jgi:transposase InsO family protein
MRRNGIRARGTLRFRVATTNSNHALPIAPNLLARNFNVAAANTVWAGGMTYISTGEG